MPTTDTSEKGLETLIFRAMTGLPHHPDAPGALHDPGAPYGGTGWIAGNPPNPHSLKTAYLWQQTLTLHGLTDILENYAQIVEKKNEKTGKKKREQIFPRYHQLDVVRKLLVHAGAHGAGQRYLIQHSAGSGKSNSIAWLAHQLIGLRHNDQEVFASIIVVTDRRILDQQIRIFAATYAPPESQETKVVD